jgi:hypothetical protein
MADKEKFPYNVFPDVDRGSFNKFTKKNVTEDYIIENLKLQGWDCYAPFVDTGIDIIASKIIKSGDKALRLYRFIQVKTRELVNGSFGYTLKSKDFRTDPRHFFLLYCDNIDEIILIGMDDYLRIFESNYEMGITHFANPTFRYDNNKLNSLKFFKSRSCKWNWTYRSSSGNKTICFDEYRNENGLRRMENIDIDLNIESKIREISNRKFNLFYRFNKTKSVEGLLGKANVQKDIDDSLELLKNENEDDYINRIKSVDRWFIEEHPNLYISHKKYVYSAGDLENDED